MIPNGKYAGVKDINVTPGADNNLSIWQQTKVREAYVACVDKGGVIPVEPTLENLPSTISNLPNSIFSLSSDGTLTKIKKWSAAPAKKIGSRILYNMYYQIPVDEVDMSTVEEIDSYGCYYAFHTSGLKRIRFDNLRVVGERGLFWALRSNPDLTELLFPSLERDNGSYALNAMCHGCTNLSKVEFPKLSSLTGTQALQSGFANTALTSLSFPKLKTVTNEMQFSSMLSGVTGCTVHFLKSMKSVMENYSSVLNGFGGTNTTVLFDLEEE